MNEEVVIIADKKGEGYYFAKGVYEYLISKGDRRFGISLANIEETQFRDGEFKFKLSDNIRRKQCFYIVDSNKKPAEWFAEMAFTLEAISSSSPSETNAIFPYMRFCRQDRKDESRVSVNAKVVADVTSLYADRCMTVDLHSPQIQQFFGVPVDNLYSFPTVVSYMIEKHRDILENLVIVSPDLGGGKRAEALAKRFENRDIKVDIALGHKTREKSDSVAKTTIVGNVRGMNAFVIDDIIDTGNTIVSTGKVLLESGASSIMAYGTHGIFSDGVEKFSDFRKILVSDTLKLPQDGNIEIVSLIQLFGEAIYRTVIGESLSVLFDN